MDYNEQNLLQARCFFVVAWGACSLMHTTKKATDKICCSLNFGESAEARTRDPNIKSVVAPRPSKSLACGSTFKGNLLSYGFLSQPRFTQNLSSVFAILTCGLHSGLHQYYFRVNQAGLKIILNSFRGLLNHQCKVNKIRTTFLLKC